MGSRYIVYFTLIINIIIYIFRIPAELVFRILEKNIKSIYRNIIKKNQSQPWGTNQFGCFVYGIFFCHAQSCHAFQRPFFLGKRKTVLTLLRSSSYPEDLNLAGCRQVFLVDGFLHPRYIEKDKYTTWKVDGDCHSHVLVYHGPLQIATFWELRHLLSPQRRCQEEIGIFHSSGRG